MQTVSASFYEFIFLIVGVAGFEPTTPCSQSRCANRTALHPATFLKGCSFQKRCKDREYFLINNRQTNVFY